MTIIGQEKENTLKFYLIGDFEEISGMKLKEIFDEGFESGVEQFELDLSECTSIEPYCAGLLQGFSEKSNFKVTLAPESVTKELKKARVKVERVLVFTGS